MKGLFILLTAALSFGQTAITTKQLESCNRRATVYDVSKEQRIKRTRPNRSVGDMRVGEQGYVSGLMSINERVYVTPSSKVFAKPGEQPDPEDLDSFVDPETHIRKVATGVEVDCDREASVVTMDDIFVGTVATEMEKHDIPVVGQFRTPARSTK